MGFVEEDLKMLLSVNILYAEVVGEPRKMSSETIKLERIEHESSCCSSVYKNTNFDTNLFHKYVSRTHELL